MQQTEKEDRLNRYETPCVGVAIFRNFTDPYMLVKPAERLICWPCARAMDPEVGELLVRPGKRASTGGK